MANNVQQYQQPPTQQPPPPPQQQQQQPGNSSPHHCKECGLYLNSAESLEVHLQYHKENLLNKWATQASTAGAQHSEEANNNNSAPSAAAQSGVGKPLLQPGASAKREFGAQAVAAAADSSDAMMMKKSPEYGSRATPEINVSFGHPPTPQSYHSASSPYQTTAPDNAAFSPGFQGGGPLPQQQQQSYQSFQEVTAGGGFYGMEAYSAPPAQQQEYVAKMGHQAAYGRYHHPYQQPHGAHQVSSSSPAYPPQPTPSPSPKQCDKCGYVCESAAQLIEHLSVAHPPTPAPPHYQQQGHFVFGGEAAVKHEEPDVQSEILDLDSHKVVHQVYPDEGDKRAPLPDMNGHHHHHHHQQQQQQHQHQQHPHSVSAMLGPWAQQQQQQQQQQVAPPPKMMFPEQVFHGQAAPAQHAHEFGAGMLADGYRPFEHLPPQPPAAPVISSTQVAGGATAQAQAPAAGAKGTNWKSNEARRPKTYNCTACNKWFTSSGHLKRHYNTTLHKNAVKSSGQPDPATLPISAHHHPSRDSAANRDEHAGASPGDDDGYERPPAAPSLAHGHAHPHTHPLQPHTHPASPPNGEAGLSATTTTTNIDSRGLQSISNQQQQQQQHTSSSASTHSSSTSHNHGYSHLPPPPGHHHHHQHHHMMTAAAAAAAAAAAMDGQFQMYPNEYAPHATQATAATTSSHSTTGEQQQQQQQLAAAAATTAPPPPPQQPLPSFAQFNNRYGLLLGYNAASVGGPGPATVPYSASLTTYYAVASLPPQPAQEAASDYKLTELTSAAYDGAAPPPPPPPSPEKAHTKRDFEAESTGSPRITSTSGHTAIAQISKDGVHKCIDCAKVFNKSCYLTQHNKTFHSGDKPFKCTRCGKRFSVEDQYQEHLAKHAGDKPHKCDLCPKQFNHKTDLRRHMCLHTGQKPYSCDICRKGFIRKDHMLKHWETHSRKANAKNQQLQQQQQQQARA